MSTPPSASPDQSASPGGLKSLLPLIVALLAGLAVGGGAGAFVVGPAMAKGIGPAGAAPKPAPADHAEEGEEESSDHAAEEEGEEEEEEEQEEPEGEAKAAEKGSEKPAHTIDNLVLNPAESGGTRFLLLTVTFEVKNAAVLEKMKARDAELRDAVLVTLGKKTVEQLADMAHREQLRLELRDAATKLFKKGSVRRVYFPQFVIQ